jgi:methionine-gamma-lyase
MRYFGGIMSPFPAYLILRGTQTLPLRVERHNFNAQRIAEFLESHPKVGWVSDPGLSSHPQHALAKKQMRGFGGMVCFDLKGGVDAGARLMNAVSVCSLAVSLGDTRTLITHRRQPRTAWCQRERGFPGRDRRAGASRLGWRIPKT